MNVYLTAQASHIFTSCVRYSLFLHLDNKSSLLPYSYFTTSYISTQYRYSGASVEGVPEMAREE